MACFQLFLSFLIIFQLVSNSLALKRSDKQIKLYTPTYGFNSDRHYQYYETSATNCLSFKVRAEKDAHIALAAAPDREEPWIEIVIGGWGNSRSVIRKNETDYIQENTELDSDVYKGFWITWNEYGEIRVGREGETIPFMKWDDPSPFDIEYFAVSLCWGTSGSWIIEEPSCPNVKVEESTETPFHTYPKCVMTDSSMNGSSIVGSVSSIILMIITYIIFKLF